MNLDISIGNIKCANCATMLFMKQWNYNDLIIDCIDEIQLSYTKKIKHENILCLLLELHEARVSWGLLRIVRAPLSLSYTNM